MLQDSYFELKRMAAPGVDGVTWHAYGQDLEERIDDLHGRVHRGAYRAQPSKRAWIPKADGRQRPLGIAALEDKIVQQAVKTVLEQIYEEDFLGFSYGFRPWRSCHNALDALYVGIEHRKVNWVLDADIRGFFDNIDHEWMLKFLKHRIADQTDTAPDPEMADGGSVRRRPMVADDRRYTPGLGDFTAPCERIPALRLRPVGEPMAGASRARIGDHRPLRRRFRHGLPIASGCRTVPARATQAHGAVRSPATPRKDPAHRVRTLCGRTT